MEKTIRIFALNKKALLALKALKQNHLKQINHIVIGEDKNVQNDYSKEIIEFCIINKISFSIRSRSEKNTEKYLIAIGWRWLIETNSSQQLIVFHDSLLPKYRGFNPLVSALINGDKEIGVTCLKGAKDFDRGDIILQYSKIIEYPLTISAAIDLVSEGYCKLLKKLFTIIISNENLVGEEQDDNQATYSVWRDKEDYYINWMKSANEIKKFVDAVGFPYEGAKAYMDGQEIIIDEVEIMPTIHIENEGIGKVLYKEENYPIIICGNGLLKILKIRTIEGIECEFPKKFRYRFK